MFKFLFNYISQNNMLPCIHISEMFSSRSVKFRFAECRKSLWMPLKKLLIWKCVIPVKKSHISQNFLLVPFNNSKSGIGHSINKTTVSNILEENHNFSTYRYKKIYILSLQMRKNILATHPNVHYPKYLRFKFCFVFCLSIYGRSHVAIYVCT